MSENLQDRIIRIREWLEEEDMELSEDIRHRSKLANRYRTAAYAAAYSGKMHQAVDELVGLIDALDTWDH